MYIARSFVLWDLDNVGEHAKEIWVYFDSSQPNFDRRRSNARLQGCP